MENIRCALYARISVAGKQENLNQLEKLREVASLKGLVVVKEFTDEMSGGKGRESRKGFDALIKGAVKKDFDTIMVWAVDRLGRSLQDLIAFLNEIHSVNCDLYIHNSGLDSSTPSGKMMFSMMGVFAEFEREMIKARTKLALQRYKNNGGILGRPKILNPGLISSIKYMRENGEGIRKISENLRVGVSTIYRVLKEAA